MTGWQQRVAVFARRHNLLHDPDTHTLDLVSEVGEIAKEMLLATDYGQRAPQFRSELAGEIGDALYSLLALAEVCGVDAEDALNDPLQKYERRLVKHGGVGSA
ncbi:MAG: MazG nucleotide pyrophosphohydrolase domain-containing protein [Anaerolineae bacterium]|jgi:NTP pyrophosphatase (non-canonical NTP hydrolase)